MNKIKLLYLLVAAVCLVSFTSCDDDDESEPSQQALLTAGVWEGASIYWNNGDSSQFVLDQGGFDIREFSYRFDDNGEYRETLGRTTLGTWEFAGTNQEEIILDRGETYERRLSINELSETELFLESSWFGSQIGPMEFRFTRP